MFQLQLMDQIKQLFNIVKSVNSMDNSGLEYLLI